MAQWQFNQDKELITALEERLKEAEKVIEFYGDTEKMECITCDCVDPEIGQFVRKDDFEYLPGWEPHGKMARAYMEKHK